MLFKQESSEKLAKELKLKLNKKLEDITKKSDKADCSSEVFMVNFDKFSNLSNSSADKNLTIIDLNLNLRISHLLFLAVLSVDKVSFYIVLGSPLHLTQLVYLKFKGLSSTDDFKKLKYYSNFEFVY